MFEFFLLSQLAQQVALAEIEIQVSAKVIIVREDQMTNYTVPRQPQRDALMNLNIITASI